MAHTYDISGMNCNDCCSNVEKALNTIDVIKASITLNPPITKITMAKYFLTKVFQKALTGIGDYKITIGKLAVSLWSFPLFRSAVPVGQPYISVRKVKLYT